MIRHLDNLVKQEKMTEKEISVLKSIYGIHDENLTLKEVGGIFCVTGKRIAQIRNKAFRKLRHPSRAKLWRYPR
jgi:RNA polymerase primary sigma factor